MFTSDEPYRLRVQETYGRVEALGAHPPISTVTAWQQDEQVTNYPATVQLVLNQTRFTSPGCEDKGKRESKIYLRVTRKLCFSCQLFPPNPVQEAESYRISLRPFGEMQQQFSVKKKMVNWKMSNQTRLKITQVAKIKIK